jgi:hypothetical protein
VQLLRVRQAVLEAIAQQ